MRDLLQFHVNARLDFNRADFLFEESKEIYKYGKEQS